MPTFEAPQDAEVVAFHEQRGLEDRHSVTGFTPEAPAQAEQPHTPETVLEDNLSYTLHHGQEVRRSAAPLDFTELSHDAEIAANGGELPKEFKVDLDAGELNAALTAFTTRRSPESLNEAA